jgi:hypothetical protein
MSVSRPRSPTLPTTIRRSLTNAPQRAGAAHGRWRGVRRCESGRYPFEPPASRTGSNGGSRARWRPLAVRVSNARPSRSRRSHRQRSKRNGRGERRDRGRARSSVHRTAIPRQQRRRSSANTPQRAGASQLKVAMSTPVRKGAIRLRVSLAHRIWSAYRQNPTPGPRDPRLSQPFWGTLCITGLVP